MVQCGSLWGWRNHSENPPVTEQQCCNIQKDRTVFPGCSRSYLLHISRFPMNFKIYFGVAIWLVVSIPLKNINQLGWLFPIYCKNKKCSKPPTT
jgi:hypothetical protein